MLKITVYRIGLFVFPVILLFLSVFFYYPEDSFTSSFGNVNALRTLIKCMGDADQATRLWANLPVKTNPQCLELDLVHAGSPQIAIVLHWINGREAPVSVLEEVRVPFQLIYSWRDQQWDISQALQISDNVNKSAFFPVQLARWIWSHEQMSLAADFADFALHVSPTEEIAWSLINSIIPTSNQDGADSFLEIRRGIAKKLPDYSLNYYLAFETFRRLGDWRNASEFCSGLQQHSSSATEVAAATCDARIAFYRLDYETARMLLEPRVKKYGDNVTFLIWYGNSLLRTDRWMEAEEVYKHAIQLEKEDSVLLNLYWRLGDAQSAQAKLTEAAYSYAKALQYATSEQHATQLQALLHEIQK